MTAVTDLVGRLDDLNAIDTSLVDELAGGATAIARGRARYLAAHPQARQLSTATLKAIAADARRRPARGIWHEMLVDALAQLRRIADELARLDELEQRMPRPADVIRRRDVVRLSDPGGLRHPARLVAAPRAPAAAAVARV